MPQNWCRHDWSQKLELFLHQTSAPEQGISQTILLPYCIAEEKKRGGLFAPLGPDGSHLDGFFSDPLWWCTASVQNFPLENMLLQPLTLMHIPFSG